MKAPVLISLLTKMPQISEARKTRIRFSSLFDRVDPNDPASNELALLLAAFPKAHDLLMGIASHSPYLWKLAHSDVHRLVQILNSKPGELFDHLVAKCNEAPIKFAGNEAGLMRCLRQVKQEAALLIALADIGGVWPFEQITEALSRLADIALKVALKFSLQVEASLDKIELSDGIEEGCGFVILALGKHGSKELNYSSDIDIVMLYDPERARLTPGIDAAPFFVRVAKSIVRIIDQHTPDGYVFRVDLRLRPDPASTPIAISVHSAFAYYESVGQNWERAAMIKARPVAGDKVIGELFLADLAPFIWRKYFDFAAIADIHAMKRQIHAVRGHEAIAVAGHDIKLGRGGIREIEFFVQTQQLVFGGRRAALRGPKTLVMLQALCTDGWISIEARDDLSVAYRFLREVEHRLQMIADEQTQRLPSDIDELNRFARFCGFSGVAAFSKALIANAKRVERHYSRLFEEGANLAVGEGSLVFTGTVDDPDTIDTLRRMGFSEPEKAIEIVRGWHFGRRSAVTSPRAREVLTELVPSMLKSFGESADPDGALNTFDRVLGGMPAAVELFSILREHRPILALFADILGSAPRLADIVSHRPHLLDAIIDPAFVEPTPRLDDLIERISAAIGSHELIEDFLDRLRETGQHEMFLVGVRMLSGVISPAMAGEAYSAIAEAIIRITLVEVETRFARDHGKVKGGRIAVLGMGRLGSREMTATSDLDLIVLYDFDVSGGESDGTRPLDPVVYYGRLTNRLISALTVPTRQGTLYAVDMRLRPSGNKGPAATQYHGFLSYHAEGEAETWEHLALVRARPVAGQKEFMALVANDLQNIISMQRNHNRLVNDVIAMRNLIAQEKGDADSWDLKLARGGLMDIEFIAQTLVLLHANSVSSLRQYNTADILMAAREASIIAIEDAVCLLEGYGLMRDLIQWQRAMVVGEFNPTTADHSFLKRLAAIIGLPDFRLLDSHLKQMQAKIRMIFEKTLVV
ncbi:MAG: bifunctional [glutamine synthetase] adenylyltransferase/[glutamine synthetase]-adenylyl-L-tyrosine phosphorylase [Beijerinckiaceae bacterium]|nr:bifunctional [glutamine synthetase] adenylyltransferase/[glutamine synthetase]-adenylyl-L-tyrosine phosphorylase [Beijerinckiaceae bacterium]